MKRIDGGNQAAPIIPDTGGSQLAVPVTSNQLAMVAESLHRLIDEQKLTNALLGEVLR